MKRLLPNTLQGQFVLIMLAALLLSQLASFLLIESRWRYLEFDLFEPDVFARTAELAIIANRTEKDKRQEIGILASGPFFFVQFTDKPLVSEDRADSEYAEMLKSHLPEHKGAIRLRSVGEESLPSSDFFPVSGHIPSDIATPVGDIPVLPTPPIPASAGIVVMQSTEFSLGDGIEISIELDDAEWLNVFAFMDAGFEFPLDLLVALIVSALAVGGAAAWAAGRISRPLSHLALAANRFGKSVSPMHVPEEGPDDVRLAARAFNTMSDRVKQTLEEQNAVMSAVGHDLRTPITSLRIRAEMIGDPALEQKMIETLDGMERLCNAVVEAARGGASHEEPERTIDIASLIEAEVDDFIQMGCSVKADIEGSTKVTGRPQELRRALRNLLQNAAQYANGTTISLHRTPDNIEIRVDDNGPGIPEDQLANVLKPFVRLEESRNPETGGFGLGLNIAASIARRHGGELTLSNLTPRGLRASLKLPVTQSG